MTGAIAVRRTRGGTGAGRAVLSRPGVLLGLGILGVFATAAVAPGLLSPYDPTVSPPGGLDELGRPLPPLSAGFPLGTDELGRDQLSRLIHATRSAFLIAVVPNAVALLIATIVGVTAGYFRGWPELVLMRTTEVILVLPAFLVSLAILATFGRSLTVLVVTLALVTWPYPARVVYGETLRLREEAFVEAARSIGASPLRIVALHIVPQLRSLLLVYFTLNAAFMVLLEAGLSFLGFGTPPPAPTWGSMLAAAPHNPRSRHWFESDDINGFNHRAWLKPLGLSDEALAGRPVVGIANTFSEFTGCNVHLRQLAEHVKRGVWQAGGVPLEFPVLSLSETLMKPNAMLYRNLAAMDVEEMIRSHPMDAVVLLSSCDKTTPAVLMGAASANVPTVLVTGGPQLVGMWRGEEVGSGTDFWRVSYDRRHGRITEDEYREFEGALVRSHGHCMEMATAMSMAVAGEALGITLPDNAAVPATDSRRAVLAERSGRRAVEMIGQGLTPREVLTREAFGNAITVTMAVGGSTNAVVHLLAVAGRLGLDIGLDDWAAAHDVPVLADLRPSGVHLLERFFHAGGIPALMGELGDLLDGSCRTVNGRTVDENRAGRRSLDHDVIRPLSDPVVRYSGIAVLRGSLAPNGAVLKRSASSPHLFRHRGPAYVFDDVQDLAARLDDPDLPVTADTVLVLRGAGPLGAPGMPEWGHIPVPGKLEAQGVTDVVRISDARISGGSHGTMIVHVSPEAAVGGPLAAVRTGDMIRLDVEAGVLDLEVDEAEIARRLAEDPPRRPVHFRRGYGVIFSEQVLQADQGCDFRCLRGLDPEEKGDLPLGIIEGWVLGD